MIILFISLKVFEIKLARNFWTSSLELLYIRVAIYLDLFSTLGQFWSVMKSCLKNVFIRTSFVTRQVKDLTLSLLWLRLLLWHRFDSWPKLLHDTVQTKKKKSFIRNLARKIKQLCWYIFWRLCFVTFQNRVSRPVSNICGAQRKSMNGGPQPSTVFI